MYFAQGLGEPTAGLITQPVESLLKTWGKSAAEIAAFGAVLSIPWTLKPIYGLLSDFVPIRGGRRRGYLLLTTFATAITCFYLYAYPPVSSEVELLLGILLVTTVGVAFSDVAIDGLMVEKGQPLGMTGRFQSIQWGSMYAATLIVGVLGGYLSGRGLQHVAFLVCGVFAVFSWLLVYVFVRNEPRARRATFSAVRRHLLDAVRLPGLIPAAIFLFLWNFNPFSQSVLYVHMTREMGMSEQFYGVTISVLSLAAVGASVIYGLYCRRIGFGALLHACIIAGILSTLSYAFMTGTTSALVVTVAVGFTYMIATLIQLDLAARVCRPETAATTFAVLMAISNLGYSLSAGLGGQIYDFIGARSGYPAAFQILVFVGASFTGLCWFVFPALNRSDRQARELG